jgi:hypothetical protein
VTGSIEAPLGRPSSCSDLRPDQATRHTPSPHAFEALSLLALLHACGTQRVSMIVHKCLWAALSRPWTLDT